MCLSHKCITENSADEKRKDAVHAWAQQVLTQWERNAEIVLLFSSVFFLYIFSLFFHFFQFGLRLPIELNYVLMRTYWIVVLIFFSFLLSLAGFIDCIPFMSICVCVCVCIACSIGKWAEWWKNRQIMVFEFTLKKINKLTTPGN